ncbi:Type I secretion system membrane fusion protein PrsE [Ruegeria sp. THAF57]|uniref:HlyD family type I secretion periplasmic adaptor subunit n=1 Tax=Ruegeria sp. THAF57 TaxID=2744555 RepID=UPI0015DFF5E3|nr:HlyD family type I secretion periplasmic adaptor subunit [Ruegeria sp. THAF57]CAD0183954.1 Type I secretion system membrane fusion protein PrsE [Ruegeria sp. THAF57]
MSNRDWELVDFAQGPDAGRLRRSSGWVFPILMGLLLVIGCALIWASLARIEELARATGRVVPLGQARVVESLEGGIVRDIAVREGDTVEAGQILVRLDDTSSAASLGELHAQQRALRARALRLEAELAGGAQPDFTNAGIDPNSSLAVRESALFDSRTASYLGQSAVLDAQVQQRVQEIAELSAALDRVAENIALLDEEIQIKSDSGIVPRAQILPVERERSARRQERDALTGRREQARAALTEANARVTEAELQRRAEINIERSDTLNQLSVINESIKSATDVVNRAALRAPVDGVISTLNVHTIGAVIAPGEEVLRIVPADDSLLIEARAKPEDVAFLRPGLPASIKLTSFDFTVYGALDGEVTRVGVDAEQDEATGEIFFPIIVETQSNALEKNGQRLEIRPGMVASIDILTGERTVLDYILKPFRKARFEALRER